MGPEKARKWKRVFSSLNLKKSGGFQKLSAYQIARFTYSKLFALLQPVFLWTSCMCTKIENDIAQIKRILATLVGAADRSVENPFSEEILDKVAKDFLRLSIERGDWVKDDDIRKFIKTAPHNAGSFLRNEFAFANWYRHGHQHYYSKKDLVAFNEQLQKRNIDLSRYQEMLEDKRAFEKSFAKKALKKVKKTAKGFKMPHGVKNITTSDIPKPDPEIVKADLARLKEEFKQNNLAAYIDVYKGVHAMMKHNYMFRRYLEKGLPQTARKWCDDFNYANDALKAITGKKQKFDPPEDKNAIEL